MVVNSQSIIDFNSFYFPLNLSNLLNLINQSVFAFYYEFQQNRNQHKPFNFVFFNPK
jgi:hypothetical protein